MITRKTYYKKKGDSKEYSFNIPSAEIKVFILHIKWDGVEHSIYRHITLEALQIVPEREIWRDMSHELGRIIGEYLCAEL